MKKRKLQKIFIGILAIICLVLIAFFVKDIMIDLFKYQSQGNEEGMKEVIESHGIFGMIAIVVIQAFQMFMYLNQCIFIQWKELTNVLHNSERTTTNSRK